MERYRLKNIIILILVLVNLSLLSSLLYSQKEKHGILRRTEDELVQLFAASDITLARSAISWDTPPASISMSRSSDQERELAQLLLGSPFRETSQGGINTYYSGNGTLQIRSNGSYEATLFHFSTDTAEFLKSFSSAFSYSEPIFSLDEDGTGSASLTCLYENRPVYNAGAQLVLTEGKITSVSGTLLPKIGSLLGETEPLSCSAALTTFLQMRLTEGTVGSSILSTHLCYEFQSTSASAISLSSAWCIETDVATYYVNASTGTITVG